MSAMSLHSSTSMISITDSSSSKTKSVRILRSSVSIPSTRKRSTTPILSTATQTPIGKGLLNVRDLDLFFVQVRVQVRPHRVACAPSPRHTADCCLGFLPLRPHQVNDAAVFAHYRDSWPFPILPAAQTIR